MPDSSLRGRVATIIRLRIGSDGEGVRSVVFLYGCPLSCKWCCNPETRFGGNYQSVTPKQLLELVLRDEIYFLESGGGITFSGGEPLMQYPFIREFARLVQGRFSIDMETSLYAPREALEALLPVVNRWNIDCKAPTEQTHLAYTGVPREVIRENLRWLSRQVSPDRITLTWPIVPGYTDGDDQLEDVISLLRELGLHQISLHPHRVHSMEKYPRLGLQPEITQSLPAERLRQIRQALTEAGFPPAPAEFPREREKCPILKIGRAHV